MLLPEMTSMMILMNMCM